jgi:uncharacterized protein YaaR (DUF327 family)
MEEVMQFYYNLNPPQYEGESDLVTIEAPTEVMDILFTYAKQITDTKNIHDQKAVKEIIKESVNIILSKSYERKNRKTKKR